MNDTPDLAASIIESTQTSIVESALRFLADPSLDALFWRAERLGSPSAWWLHVPFAHWIVCAARPSVLVELGTHYGVSYSAFCQAVRLARLPTRCHAVDTWHGDTQAGQYDDAVFNEFSAYHNEQFGTFSTLIRSSFDEALDVVEDGSVDLLHIDGFHTYEAVRHDFESWKPKLSAAGVVLFHDINERSGEFGVWRLWEELSRRYPSFTFLHGHGLGVLAIGERAPAQVLELCQLRDPACIARIRDRFAQLGNNWLSETRERMLGQRIGELTASGDQLRAALAQATGPERAALQTELATLRSRVEELEDALQREQGAAAERAQTEARLRDQAAQRAAAARREAQEQIQRSQDELAELRRQVALAQVRADTAQSRADQAEARADQAEAAHGQAVAERNAFAQGYESIVQSTAWRATWPLRTGARGLPPGLRRAVRGGLKLGWWTARGQLFSRLRNRRERIAQLAGQIEVRPEELVPAPAAAAALPEPERAAPAVAPPGPLLTTSMRLVYVSGEPATPGHIYRVERYLAIAVGLGVQAVAIEVGEIPNALSLIEDATVLVLWRTLWCDEVAAAVAAARRGGARIVFDVDDLMVDPSLARLDVIDGIRTQYLTEDVVRAHYESVRTAMLHADVCFTTTDELAFHSRKHAKPTYVLPNGFDQAAHDLSRRAAAKWRRSRPDACIRIGYAGGSRTHQKDFGVAVQAIAKVLREHPMCRLVLFQTPDGSARLIDVEEFPELAGLEHQIEWRPLQPLKNLPTELARFDINIAPLEYGNPFCEAKSELKFFEAALVDVPTIASPTGPFERAIEHGKTGFLAASAEDWYDALSRLVEDPDLRGRVAAAAYRSALAAFGPVQRMLRFRRVLAQLHGGPAGADAFALEARRASQPWTEPRIFESDVVFAADKGGFARVSVIVPLYNYAHCVVEALDSVYAQTLRELDLVIVDGCSTDNSLEVAVGWAKRQADRFNRIVVLKNRDNIGLGLCRNSGFEAARTQYVLPLDADNKLLPDCCAQLLEVIEREGTGFVYSSIGKFGEASSGQISAVPWNAQRQVAGNWIDAMALVSKEAWAVVGGYDHVRFGWEDYDFWCRMSEHGLVGHWVPEPLSLYRVHATSMSWTQTHAAGNYRRLIDDFKRRHPWVSLVDDYLRRNVPKSDPRLREGAARSRLDALLPILRCPDTGGRLAWNEDRTALLSVIGTRSWPVTNGRPVLAAHLQNPPVYPETHISNELPEEALALIREAKGYVLNLSAGGSLEKFDHVVEVEYAVFRHTDIVADAHVLPFYDETFEAVIVMNAFEHYREPHKVAAELRRVLKPGGRVLVRTAFLQPLHEKPWHFYNCTRYGLEEWFKAFETETLHVSRNFCPNHTMAWLASEAEMALREDVSAEAAEAFAAAPVGKLVEIWRDPAKREDRLWTDFEKLSQTKQEVFAAGFELLGRKKLELPDLGKKPAAKSAAS